MASLSKEDKVVRLVLENSPMKEWHFGEVVEKARVNRAVANKWLGKLVREGILKRVKEGGRFPYFTAGQNNRAYLARKRVYALEELERSGLLKSLMELEEAKAVVIFGSFAKGDWYRDSDVDVFICGKAVLPDKNRYERRLGRRIELHLFRDREELEKVRTGLLKNVANGYLVKGRLEEFASVS